MRYLHKASSQGLVPSKGSGNSSLSLLLAVICSVSVQSPALYHQLLGKGQLRELGTWTVVPGSDANLCNICYIFKNTFFVSYEK